jgi:hypothetical protein
MKEQWITKAEGEWEWNFNTPQTLLQAQLYWLNTPHDKSRVCECNHNGISLCRPIKTAQWYIP